MSATPIKLTGVTEGQVVTTFNGVSITAQRKAEPKPFVGPLASWQSYSDNGAGVQTRPGFTAALINTGNGGGSDKLYAYYEPAVGKVMIKGFDGGIPVELSNTLSEKQAVESVAKLITDATGTTFKTTTEPDIKPQTVSGGGGGSGLSTGGGGGGGSGLSTGSGGSNVTGTVGGVRDPGILTAEDLQKNPGAQGGTGLFGVSIGVGTPTVLTTGGQSPQGSPTVVTTGTGGGVLSIGNPAPTTGSGGGLSGGMSGGAGVAGSGGGSAVIIGNGPVTGPNAPALTSPNPVTVITPGVQPTTQPATTQQGATVPDLQTFLTQNIWWILGSLLLFGIAGR